MRLLWWSTAPWGPSSYSVLTRRTVPEIVRLGYEVVVGTWYGLEGEPQKWQIRPRGEPNGALAGSVTVLPTVDNGNYSVSTIIPTYQAAKADLLLACMDSWVIPTSVTSQVKFAAWFPVDHDPAPRGVVDALAHCIYPMAFSRWGTDILKAAGVDAHYLPCSADAEIFHPMDRAKARAEMTVPEKIRDCFLVSMVAANKDPSDRKGFAEGMQGFAKFAEHHEDAYLYLHTHWGGPIAIPQLAIRLGIQDRVIKPDPLVYLMGMYDEGYMRAVYNASDVLLNPAKSEGFGLPVLEAQMCGTPVALTDFSTSRELLFAGWLIEGQRHWSIGQDSWRLLANVDSVADALEAAYAERGSEKLKSQARNGAIALDTQRVAREHWKPALREMEDLVRGVGGELKLVTF